MRGAAPSERSLVCRQVTQRLRKRSPQAPCFPDCVQDSVCAQLLALGFCLSSVSTKARASLQGQDPARLQQEPARPHHTRSRAPLPPPNRVLLTSPPPHRGFWERICFRVRACSSPSTLVWNFTMDSQAHGSSSGVGRKWGKGKEMVSDCLLGRRVVIARGQNCSALGSVGPGTCKKAERHVEVFRQSSQE